MKSLSIKFLYAFLCICLLQASIGVQTVYAAPDIIVNSTADTSGTCATSGTGTCTLRDAITFANTQTGLDYSAAGTTPCRGLQSDGQPALADP
jgi:CSLREA domain-containing protein